ncbi:hypothetical protein [Virgibacillus halodenitrificans]|uniref:hypothetical protein n=1 Tax=Virgibacillus halodenitrificans TaxID=1482 RepID=UPI002DBFCA63|nr:hypothetical protein [Virgibacillus halodenitrificans]MEC2157661.1 hypothetical protein [Virgibacillus halodenitrificans]
MKNDSQEDEVEKSVYKILNEFIESKNLSINMGEKPSNSSSPESNLKDEEIDLIGNLFG